MKYLAPFAGIMVLLLALGIPGVNVYHHLELPTLNKYRIVMTRTPSLSHLFAKHIDITLEDQIRSNIWYEDVMKALREAKEGDTVTFHLSGYGGEIDSMYLLINGVRASKAIVTMSVEGSVYSADAELATAGDYLVMGKYTWLMFHSSTILNVDCSQQKGTDRGVSNVEHCQAFKDASLKEDAEFARNNPILTDTEKASIASGHDVYLSSDEVLRRQIMIKQYGALPTDLSNPEQTRPVLELK